MRPMTNVNSMVLSSFSRVSLLVLSLIGSSAQAQTDAIDPAQLAAVMTELRAAILPAVKTVSRPVYLFHWTNRSSAKLPLTGDIPANDPRFLQYAAGSASAYFRYVATSRDMLGNGLYLSIDPAATRHYGAKGKTWTLLALAVKPGTRVIDVAGSNQDPNISSAVYFSSDLRSRLLSFGCPAPGLVGLLSMAKSSTENYGSGASGKKCQALRVAIARDPILQAKGVAYGYPASGFSGCGSCGSAYNFWDTSGFDPALSRGLTQPSGIVASNDPDRTLKGMIAASMEYSGSWDGFLSLGLSIPFPEFKGKIPVSSFEAWTKKFLIGCDKNKAREDGVAFN
jgi:hypothetical protein